MDVSFELELVHFGLGLGLAARLTPKDAVSPRPTAEIKNKNFSEEQEVYRTRLVIANGNKSPPNVI